MNFLDKPPPAAARDNRMPTQPVAQVQRDGNPSAQQIRPTKTGIVQRPSAPMNYNTSGMENAMGTMADKMHPRRKR